MGFKLIILLGLLLGVLYCIHILVQDYQAVTAPKLLRILFKRDISSHQHNRSNVRWRKILMYDRIQCIRFLYCELGTRPLDEEIRRGFVLMLSLEPREEDSSSLVIFKQAYEYGQHSHSGINYCRKKYPMCPFQSSLLIDLIKYLLRHHYTIE
ncbi:unnamed protein product [Parnassius apollo]|uniref:(apollo) hypothetical protein n=1 Tax=Parnassius apollo TaxID=110799 RepID=A0A8S3WQH4_PARAO|nr:unnamed protein product [Parnassius apollo]